MGIHVCSNEGPRLFPGGGGGITILTNLDNIHRFAEVRLLLGNVSQKSDVAHAWALVRIYFYWKNGGIHN